MEIRMSPVEWSVHITAGALAVIGGCVLASLVLEDLRERGPLLELSHYLSTANGLCPPEREAGPAAYSRQWGAWDILSGNWIQWGVIVVTARLLATIL
jgi:hypothetical protein